MMMRKLIHENNKWGEAAGCQRKSFGSLFSHSARKSPEQNLVVKCECLQDKAKYHLLLKETCGVYSLEGLQLIIAVAKSNMWEMIYYFVMEFSMMRFHVMLNCMAGLS